MSRPPAPCPQDAPLIGVISVEKSEVAKEYRAKTELRKLATSSVERDVSALRSPSSANRRNEDEQLTKQVQHLFTEKAMLQRRLKELERENAHLHDEVEMLYTQVDEQADEVDAAYERAMRDAANVVLYEDAARARLHGFLRALEGVRGVLRAVRAFDGVRSRLESPALLAIVTEGDTDDADTTWATNDAAWGACAGASTPELSERLAFFERAFDWDKARESGRIEPKPGADEAVDAADDRVCAADEALREWLVGTRKKLGGSKQDVNLVSANKDTHLCEVSDALAGKVPADWSREGKRKGFEKFDCPELKALRAEREAAGEARELALENVLRALVAKFCDDWPRWRRASEAAAAVLAADS